MSLCPVCQFSCFFVPVWL